MCVWNFVPHFGENTGGVYLKSVVCRLCSYHITLPHYLFSSRSFLNILCAALFNPSKRSGNYVSPSLSITNSEFCPTLCVYGLRKILRVNSDYISKRKKQIIT
jgi:hypothetical protein